MTVALMIVVFIVASALLGMLFFKGGADVTQDVAKEVVAELWVEWLEERSRLLFEISQLRTIERCAQNVIDWYGPAKERETHPLSKLKAALEKRSP